MDHHLSHGESLDGTVPPVASTPSPKLWPWIFRLLNNLLPATLGVHKAPTNELNAVAAGPEYVLKVCLH